MNSSVHLFLALILAVLVASCTQWEYKKIPVETFLSQKWKAIDLHKVETYPTFDFCDELAPKEVLKSCFENEVSSTLYNVLSMHPFIVDKAIQDTIYIEFIVNEKGHYCIDSLNIRADLRGTFPDLEMWLHEACEQLPIAHPATIQNIPVKTRFKIPLIFQTEI